jgi:hypothetical protein
MGHLVQAASSAVALAALVAATVDPLRAAQSNAPPERYSTVAVDLDRGGATPLQIVIERWSSEAERRRLMTVMFDQGADALLHALVDAPSKGYLRTLESLRWDLRFAIKVPGEDGGDRIVLITDRPISFGERTSLSRTLDYPFTVIELRVNASGRGDGTLSLATKIIPDKESNIVTLENWDTQRIRLQQVKRERR